MKTEINCEDESLKNDKPKTSIGQSFKIVWGPPANIGQEHSESCEIISINDSQSIINEIENSPPAWTNLEEAKSKENSPNDNQFSEVSDNENPIIQKPVNRKMTLRKKRNKFRERSSDDELVIDEPTTSTAQNPSTSIGKQRFRYPKIISVDDSQSSDDENSLPWTNWEKAKLDMKIKCPYCNMGFEKRHILGIHISTTCLLNPDSKTNKQAGRFRCEVCGRSYKEIKFLRHHVKNECQKSITCPDCGRTLQGSYIPERHKENFCVNKRGRSRKQIKKEHSPEEVFDDQSSLEKSD
ncbi:zinc finger and BTB domain-containing protein 18-like [Monomorium pharaonis]|uniref:zinc finger and BTB domain-containing protein 18-like n=1 Tax=Monomorium pharaonis TaxID=307658 RepID=UPI0017468161|nr:zinc finger and BTB domain-containing protein 18-like [Monomorium pharaonis]